ASAGESSNEPGEPTDVKSTFGPWSVSVERSSALNAQALKPPQQAPREIPAVQHWPPLFPPFDPSNAAIGQVYVVCEDSPIKGVAYSANCGNVASAAKPPRRTIIGV